MSVLTEVASAGPDSLSAEHPSADRRGTFRALVVEDDEGIVLLVRRVLEREGFSVECVRTGSAGIQLLKTVPTIFSSSISYCLS